MVDIRTLEEGDTYRRDADDDLQIVKNRDIHGIWSAPLGVPVLVTQPSGRPFEVQDVMRFVPARLALRIDSEGGDWAEVVHTPTGMVLRRAHVDECYEYICENLCESVDQTERVTGRRL